MCARIDNRPTSSPWRYMKGEIGEAYTSFSKAVNRWVSPSAGTSIA